MVLTEQSSGGAVGSDSPSAGSLRVVELFAGVGGFRVGLEKAGWDVVWSNQWEPSTKAQHASDTYVARFGSSGHSNEDINEVLDRVEAGTIELPNHDMLVGGFPCQDYSVARTKNQANGLKGRKGVLWWEIERAIAMYRPRLVFLENVDRLLKSPTTPRQPGRDFAVMLASLSDLGYHVEWRVVNAADYGFPQKRRRVFIVAHRIGQAHRGIETNPIRWLLKDGPIARALPVVSVHASEREEDLALAGSLSDITERFNTGGSMTPFLNAGIMVGRSVWTEKLEADYHGSSQTLGDLLDDAEDVPPEYWVDDEESLEKWRYLKGAKHAERVSRKTGATYSYDEGPIPFPDNIDGPARTIVTGEGGAAASRFKHIIMQNDRFRRLTPRELEKLNGFQPGWTEGVPDGRRAFLMGNALVVGLVESIGVELARL
jgi:DNA (cytosine-5)-methyltransferase 1